jgi:hypothetical protein
MKTELAHDDIHVKVFKIYGLCKLNWVGYFVNSSDIYWW